MILSEKRGLTGKGVDMGHSDCEERQVLRIGPYRISQHPPIPSAKQVNVLWIEHEDGEGMGVDLDKFWREEF